LCKPQRLIARYVFMRNGIVPLHSMLVKQAVLPATSPITMPYPLVAKKILPKHLVNGLYICGLPLLQLLVQCCIYFFIGVQREYPVMLCKPDGFVLRFSITFPGNAVHRGACLYGNVDGIVGAAGIAHYYIVGKPLQAVQQPADLVSRIFCYNHYGEFAHSTIGCKLLKSFGFGHNPALPAGRQAANYKPFHYVCTESFCMKISGFTIIKNAVTNDYPIVEAINSILPVVDEMIVSVGDSEDATTELIRSIPSDKIKIVHSTWDPTLREGGRILAVETDKAFQHVSPDSDWAFYIQADEVVHEQYHQAIREAASRYKDDRRIEGLLFHYTHFYGTYDYIGDSRKWYDREVRIIRNDRSIQSYKDAQGFRKNGRKLNVKLIDAWMYHYGWVKDPVQMKQKMYNAGKLWHSDEEMNAFLQRGEFFDFNEFDSVARFMGTHPVVMQDRIRRKNWNLQLDTSKKNFSLKNRLLYWIERATGKRLFTYTNYRII